MSDFKACIPIPSNCESRIRRRHLTTHGAWIIDAMYAHAETTVRLMPDPRHDAGQRFWFYCRWLIAIYLGPLGKPLPLPGLKGYLFTLNSSNGGGSFLSLVGIDSSLFGPFCESTSILMPRSLVFNRQWTNSPM